jgi:predicted RecA/RadA family phage recombinase
MPEAIYRQASGQQDYTPSGAVLAGAVVVLDDGRIGIVKTDLAASEKGAVYTSGIFDVTSASATTCAIGTPVYWDISADLAVSIDSGADDWYMGLAIVAKVATELVVRVDLNIGYARTVGTI